MSICGTMLEKIPTQMPVEANGNGLEKYIGCLSGGMQIQKINTHIYTCHSISQCS